MDELLDMIVAEAVAEIAFNILVAYLTGAISLEEYMFGMALIYGE